MLKTFLNEEDHASHDDFEKHAASFKPMFKGKNEKKNQGNNCFGGTELPTMCMVSPFFSTYYL